MKALETIKDHIKDLERMEGVFTFYDCFNSASECRKANKELTEAVAEIEALQSRSCEGCKQSWERNNQTFHKYYCDYLQRPTHGDFCCNRYEPKEQ